MKTLKTWRLLQNAFALCDGNILRNASLFAICAFIFLSPLNAFAQQPLPTENEDKQQDALEQLTEQDEARHLDYENIIDLTAMLQRHPINLNKATKQDLQALMDLKLINDIQITSILNYRDQLGQFISIFLFGVKPLDPVTYASVAGVLAVTAALAAAAPAIRATRVDPVEAFRNE